ncbi:MAG: hypothetical protein NTY38_31765 [Acidobacteria bacterium]|nr:hypothetical protein [Acidobacteriota bacterium]
MNESFFRELAASGLRMPVGTDLMLNEHSDPEQVMEDGRRLGQVMEATARRFRTPLALSLMDLRLEKRDLLRSLGNVDADVDTFHFEEAPGEDQIEQVKAQRAAPFAKRNQAHLDAVRYVAEETDLVAVGMAIGPFSLMTKLMKDPITAIAMAGGGVTPDEDPGVLLVHRALVLAEADLRLRRQLADAGVDLIFHDCGELTDSMVEQFATRLKPSILSLGSSRQLWSDAKLVPGDMVLFGNLPTKSFYSDSAMPDEKVESLTRELIVRMRETGHPHILGSECDVLHVPEAAERIRRKVDVMLTCGEATMKVNAL